LEPAALCFFFQRQQAAHCGMHVLNNSLGGDYAEEDDDTIRVKSLNDLVFPNPPENAGQARGYVNQVLMAIGKLQKTAGSEVYQWAQECLSANEESLKSDPRFPRTDREIALKLIKTSRTGRFELIF
jgi:hypothetical protein